LASLGLTSLTRFYLDFFEAHGALFRAAAAHVISDRLPARLGVERLVVQVLGQRLRELVLLAVRPRAFVELFHLDLG
jgi:hypothetical protein